MYNVQSKASLPYPLLSNTTYHFPSSTICNSKFPIFASLLLFLLSFPRLAPTLHALAYRTYQIWDQSNVWITSPVWLCITLQHKDIYYFSRFLSPHPETFLRLVTLVPLWTLGPFKCYVTLFFWKLDPHPPPHNANNIEPYTFVMLFLCDTHPHPHLRYVTREWPLRKEKCISL